MSIRCTYDPFKLVIDVTISALGLIVTLPLQAVLAIIIRQNLGSPVLFRQERPGKDEVIFDLVKFRTMLEPSPGSELLSDEERMTPLGSFLRSTSLDELPTLWNVVKGDMSLVGPRPLLVRYLGRYTPEQRRRHEVRPGITGLAQVNGRNELSWEAKFAKDVEYVDRRSFSLDLRILISTVSKVVKRDGISDGKSATTSEFIGTHRAGPRG